MRRIEDAGETAVAVAVDGQFAGVLAIADSLKDDAAETIAALKEMKIDSSSSSVSVAAGGRGVVRAGKIAMAARNSGCGHEKDLQE